MAAVEPLSGVGLYQAAAFGCIHLGGGLIGVGVGDLLVLIDDSGGDLCFAVVVPLRQFDFLFVGVDAIVDFDLG